MNYNLAVCLTDLQGAQVQANAQGKQFVFIPIDDADLFLTEKGKVYMNLTMWAKPNGVDQYGKTHGIKQNLSKGYRDRIGAEAAKNFPFIGSAKELVKSQGVPPQQQNQPVYQQQAPAGYQQPVYPQPQQNYAQPYSQPQSEDYPF